MGNTQSHSIQQEQQTQRMMVFVFFMTQVIAVLGMFWAYKAYTV